jgi:predicted site-specific integrase-resolvase
MLITKKQVAELAGVTPDTIVRWDRAGKMPPPRLRAGTLGRRLWDDDDIKRWLQDQSHPTHPAPPADAHASECAPLSTNS